MEQLVEEWRDVVGYEGLYQVSSTGKVMSLGVFQKQKQKRVLKLNNNHGYLQVALVKDGKKKNKYIHRMVAEAFIPNSDLTKIQIDHIDGNPSNNRVDNLHWVTIKENQLNPISRDRQSKSKMGKPNKKIWKPIEQRLNGTVICRYESTTMAEKLTGIHNSAISMCLNNKRKTAGGYEWKFIDGELVTREAPLGCIKFQKRKGD